MDTFCKTRLPERPKKPGPAPSLCVSEVLTLVLLGQWAQFQSERDFYRGAEAHLRSAFPPLPAYSQFNRLERTHQQALAAFFRYTLGGFNARLTAKEALHNFCLWLNQQVGRYPLEFADIIAW